MTFQGAMCRVVGGALLVQFVFWIPLSLCVLDLDYSANEICRPNPHITDYAGDQCIRMKYVNPCNNLQPSFTVISLKLAGEGAINSEIVFFTAELFLQCCQLLLVLGNT